MVRLIALMLALVAGALIAWSQVRPPPVAAASARSTEFSAARAFETVHAIAQAPHPTGSVANRRVREILFERMSALGLSPRVNRGDAAESWRGGVTGASTENLIGVLPGRDRSLPAVALMAHYDSRPGAPGAADDAAGVAAALEGVRAIEAQGAPLRDVAVILTDAEEVCLCGAKAVLAQDPIARRLGLVINLEARGSGGRALMFQTGLGDSESVRLFRDAAVRPLAGSLFGAVYATLPNETDFTLTRRAGLLGFNFAFTGRQFDYHQPTDAPANLQLGSLQDIGEQALAAARRAAFAPRLPAHAQDAVYGVVFGRTMIVYPPAWGWGVLAAAAALLALAMARARRSGAMPWLDVARGVGAGLYAMAAAAALLHLARATATGFIEPELGFRRLLAQAGQFELALILIATGALLFAAAETARGRSGPGAIAPLLAGLASCLLAGRLDATGLAAGLLAATLALAIGRGPIGRPGAWAGVLVLGLAIATAAQVAAPLTAYVLAWPLLLASVAAAASDLAADRRIERLAPIALIAGLTLGWAGVHTHLIVVVTGLPELLVLPLLMAALAVWPLAQPDAGAPPARLPGRALLIAGSALILFLRLHEPWDVRHPRSSFVAYHLDQDAGRAWRVGLPAQRTTWSDAVLQADGGRIARLSHWAWNEPIDAAPAQTAAIASPAVIGGARDGRLVLVVTPPPGVRRLTLHLSPTAPMRLEGAGGASVERAVAANAWTRIDWTAPPPEGLALRFSAPASGALQVRYAMTLDGWPPGVAAPKPPPPGVMSAGLSGETVATGSRQVAW